MLKVTVEKSPIALGKTRVTVRTHNGYGSLNHHDVEVVEESDSFYGLAFMGQRPYRDKIVEVFGNRILPVAELCFHKHCHPLGYNEGHDKILVAPYWAIRNMGLEPIVTFDLAKVGKEEVVILEVNNSLQ